MKAYLNEDYEDRQNMPPIQMWKTVFGEINNAESLEDVKKLYPDEPLFKNLKNKPNKARVSLISQIQTLENEFEHTPLFKDGNSDLGMYLLKKIYIEGKQISEINNDFKADLNKDYKELIDKKIDYNTTSAYGIKFPNLAFWNSFVVTRDDFPYEYKPRKASDVNPASKKKEASLSDIKRAVIEDKRPPKFKPSDNELKVLTDALLDKNPTKAFTKIKHKGGKNSEQATFVEKYFSPIMRVALEKINASDEMHDFFQHPENRSKSSKERMENYWKQNPYMRKMQSLAMSDTIKLFFEAYGADGNNEVFQNLLKYADSIKPQRQKMREEHERIQRELEEALAIYDTPKEPVEVPENNKVARTTEDLLKEEAAKFNADLYEFETEQGKVVICSNLRETFEEILKDETKFMPKAFRASFINYMLKKEELTDSYILTRALQNTGIKLPKDDRLMDEDTVERLTLEAYEDFSRKNPKIANAAQQALIDIVLSFAPSDVSRKIYTLGIFEIPDVLSGLSDEGKNAILAKSNEMNKLYAEYKKDLSESEIRKVVLAISDLLSHYETKNTIINNGSYFSEYPVLMSAVSQNLKTSKKAKDMFKEEVRAYLRQYGGTARIFLDKNVPEPIKMAKLEQFLCHFSFDTSSLYKYAAFDRNVLDNYVRYHNFELYKFLMTEVIGDIYFR